MAAIVAHLKHTAKGCFFTGLEGNITTPPVYTCYSCSAYHCQICFNRNSIVLNMFFHILSLTLW